MSELTNARARARLNHAIARGEIDRPATCPHCRSTPRPNATGAVKIWALFKEGFENWQNVEWKCISCYRAPKDVQ